MKVPKYGQNRQNGRSTWWVKAAIRFDERARLAGRHGARGPARCRHRGLEQVGPPLCMKAHSGAGAGLPRCGRSNTLTGTDADVHGYGGDAPTSGQTGVTFEAMFDIRASSYPKHAPRSSPKGARLFRCRRRARGPAAAGLQVAAAVRCRIGKPTTDASRPQCDIRASNRPKAIPSEQLARHNDLENVGEMPCHACDGTGRGRPQGPVRRL